jgi:hypothetical protein
MVGSFFTTLFAKIAAVITWFSDLFVAIFVSLWDILRDAATWVFEQGLTLASSAVGSLSLSGINANLNYGTIPANVMLVMSCIGLGQALAIITAALVIRFTLQLIPFVRLGS